MEPTSFFRNRAVGRALRVAIVLPVTMGALIWAGYPLASFLASFAILTILLTGDFSGPRWERFVSSLFVTAAGAVTLALGLLLASHLWLQVIAALVLGVAVTLIAVARGFLSKSTVPLLLPFFIAATEPPSASAWQMLAGWCLGGVVAALAAVLLWPFFPRQMLTEAVADALVTEADAVASFWGVGPAEPTQARDAVDESVAKLHSLFLGKLNRPGSAYRRERSLVRLVEETRRMRLGLRLAYRRLPMLPSKPDSDLALTTANSLAASADVLRDNVADFAPFEAIAKSRITHRDATIASVSKKLAAGDARAVQEIGPSSFRPRALSLMAMSIARDAGIRYSRGPVPPLTFLGQDLPSVVQAVRPWSQIRAELSWRAPWMLNAVRLGLALALALVVVNTMGLQRGYWVVLGTLSVMRLDLVGTRRAAGEVVLGQVAGFALGLALIHLTAGHPVIGWALLPVITAAMGYLSGNGPVWLQQAVFTLLVVELVTLSAPSSDVALVRLEDVAIGVAVAVVVSLLISPRGLVPQVERALRNAVIATSDYFQQALETLGGAAQPDAAAPSKALVRAAETIELALVQGAQQGPTLGWWLRIWGSCEYVVYAASILEVIARSQENAVQTRRAAVDIQTAGQRAVARFEKNSLELIDRCSELPARAADDDVLGVIDYSADVKHAQSSVDRVVAEAAHRREATAAEWVIQSYWQLGWVGEVDLLAANAHAVLRGAATLQTGQLRPHESAGVPVR